jgi:hypothetical protein
MMTKPTYQMELSTDGNHKIVVTVDDPSGLDAALVVAKTAYAKLLGQESQAPHQGQTDALETKVPPICPHHHEPLAWVAKGRRGPFWSCHQKDALGNWCSYTQQP